MTRIHGHHGNQPQPQPVLNFVRPAGAQQTGASRAVGSQANFTLSYASAQQATANLASPVSAQQSALQSIASRAAGVQDQVAVALPRARPAGENIGRLNAGSVGVPAVDLSDPQSPATSAPAGLYTSRGTLAMYKQPGEANAAATGVALGNRLDIEG
jgi:hypothetical protein